MKTLLTRVALGAVIALAAGCDDEYPADSPPTDEIYPKYVIETDDQGLTRVDAAFFKNGRRTRLDDGDVLEFNGWGSDFEFHGPDGSYHGEAASEQSEVSFFVSLRREYWMGALSHGFMPESLSLLSPVDGGQHPVGNEMLVSWSGAGHDHAMYLRVSANCLAPDDPALDEAFVLPVPDDGGLFAFTPADALQFEERCEGYAARLTLVRTRQGDIDESFDRDPRAEFSLNFASSVSVELTP